MSSPHSFPASAGGHGLGDGSQTRELTPAERSEVDRARRRMLLISVGLVVAPLVLVQVLSGPTESEVEEFYDNGRIQVKGHLVDGERHGTWLYFRPDGTLEERHVYREVGDPEVYLYQADGKTER